MYSEKLLTQKLKRLHNLIIRNKLNMDTNTKHVVNLESIKAMKKFSETYAKKTGTFFCSDLSITAIVIEGLAKHKDEYGAPLCPCRHYDDKTAEISSTYWNCPCVPMRERKECHCMLFLTKDNEFSSNKQEIYIN